MDIREKTVIIDLPENSKILATIYQENESEDMLKTYFAEVIAFPINTIYYFSLRIIEKTYKYVNINNDKLLVFTNCDINNAKSIMELSRYIPDDIKDKIVSQMYALINKAVIDGIIL